MPQIIIEADYSIVASDFGNTILVDASGGPIDLFLPAGHVAGQKVTIKDWKGFAATNQIRIIPFGASTVDNDSQYVFSTNYQSVVPESDGSNWVNV